MYLLFVWLLNVCRCARRFILRAFYAYRYEVCVFVVVVIYFVIVVVVVFEYDFYDMNEFFYMFVFFLCFMCVLIASFSTRSFRRSLRYDIRVLIIFFCLLCFVYV